MGENLYDTFESNLVVVNYQNRSEILTETKDEFLTSQI